jgi:hypothetical protein
MVYFHKLDKGIDTSIVRAAWRWKGKIWCGVMLELPRETHISLRNIYFIKFQHTIIQIYIYLQCLMGFRNNVSDLCKSQIVVHCQCNKTLE